MLPFALLAALVAQPANRPGCFDASALGAVWIELEGRLERQVFPGPPNYSDIRRGDLPDSAFILVMDDPFCLIEGESGPTTSFRRVHVYAADSSLNARLRAAVGRRIRVIGEGFEAHTGHHRSPLVVEVSDLRMEGSRHVRR
jgi:hypothetical protein